METEIKETNTKKDGIKKTSTAKISAVGDILCQMDMIQDAQNEDSYDFSYMFDNITKYVKKSDIAIGTLETNFTSNRYSGVGKYNTPTEFLTAVKNSGISLVSLAHNHVLDYGEDGLNQTISKIHEKGMSITGIQNNEENENSEFTGNIKEVNGIKIAFLSYTYGLSNENEISEEEKSISFQKN